MCLKVSDGGMVGQQSLRYHNLQKAIQDKLKLHVVFVILTILGKKCKKPAKSG
jgi:hypothetical protein